MVYPISAMGTGKAREQVEEAASENFVLRRAHFPFVGFCSGPFSITFGPLAYLLDSPLALLGHSVARSLTICAIYLMPSQTCHAT